MSPELDIETSLYAAVETLDGVAFLPPLGPEPAPMITPFDASLLPGLSIVLEATSAAGDVRTVATFTPVSSPRIERLDRHSIYFVNLPAAAYFTDSSASYRFRVVSSGTELGRSDLSSRVFAVLAKNPNLLMGVKIRVEQRPAPVVARLAPDTAVSGAPDFTLTVGGVSFLRESVVRFAGTNLQTEYVSRTELRATVPASLVLTPGTTAISVVSPAPGGGTSAALDFTVTPSVPVLSTIAPSAAARDAASFELTANGASFTRGSAIRFGEATLETRFVSDGRLVATIPASALQTPALTPVVVVNPGGGTSEERTFTISNPAPALTAITPASALDTSADVTLTVDGSGFFADSSVRIDGAPIATTRVSSTRLTALLPAATLTSAGARSVTVVNAGPGGGVSTSATFTVNRPQPVIASVTPSSAETNSPTITLTITGRELRAGVGVAFAGTNLTTTLVSPTELTATLPAGLLTTGGSYGVTVANAAPSVAASAPITFTVQNPLPVITALSPASGEAASGAFTLTILGAGFVRNGVVVFDGNAVASTFVSPTELRASIPAAATVSPGYDLVMVSSPAPGGGDSLPATYASNHVTPTLTSITPASATVGGGAFTLTLNGTNFEVGATASFDGAAVTTTWISATRLTAVVPASAVTSAGQVAVAVDNPPPVLGPSAPLTFTINNPVPALSTLTPASVVEGSASLTLTLDGGAFVPSSVALLDGTALATTYVSAARLTAAVPSSLVAAAGTRAITVSSPTLGGGTSVTRTFTVNRPAPVLTSLTPASTSALGAGITLTINGTGFQSGASATFNGASVTTTFVSATQVTAALTAAQLANGGSFPVNVSNATPTTGASSNLTFTVNNLVPTLTSIAPTTGTAGSGAFTLTLNGTNLSNNASATFNGTAVTTTYVSSTRVTALIPASLIASSGAFNVTVSNPAPGGGTSGAQVYTVSNPAPVLSNISPLSATSGSPGFTITAVGSSFVNGSQISFGGVTYTTTFVSASQLTAPIPSAVLASGGYREVVVTNPAPGGGTSATQIFTVNTTPANINSSITIGDGGASMYAGSSVVVGNNAVITIATNNTVNFGSLELQAGSSIVTAPCTTATCYCARITVGLDATIRANSTINTDARGYLGGFNGGNTSAIGYTSGHARPGNQANYYMGGSHGGYGGYVSDYGLGFTQIYGDALTPTLPGAGGNVYTSSHLGANGGGCVRLTVGGRLQLDGTITANGGGGSSFTSSGAGGSIWVTAGSLATTSAGAVLQANGTSSVYGSGGGGRIAVYGPRTGFTNASYQVNAGTANSSAWNGQPGSVYLSN